MLFVAMMPVIVTFDSMGSEKFVPHHCTEVELDIGEGYLASSGVSMR
jgi:hypothetical protein